jgi:hypothetical protein
MRDQPGQPTELATDPVDGRGISRRTVMRRGAIAGGALLWATPVVQSMGNASAYAWNHGSRPPGKPPGKCACSEVVTGVKPVACRPDMVGADLAASGKTVVLEMQQTSSCGSCGLADETHEIRQITGRGAVLIPRADTTSPRFEVHVTAHPATIKLRIKSRLTCVAEHGHKHTCEDDKAVTVCFSTVTGSATNRCGTVRVHKHETHLGTQACR